MNEISDKETSPPHAPDGVLIYAVGDIHGQLGLLDDLLEQVKSDALGCAAHRRVLVFVGDYVDRGPDSAGVVERLLTGLPKDFESFFLLGNHEQILLEVLQDPSRFELWMMNGGAETLLSYGVETPAPGADAAELAACRDRFARAMPAGHRSFFDRLELKLTLGDYLFVHAGIRPGVPLANQKRDDLLWIREDFLDSDSDLGAVVVHGHTPEPEPVVRPNRIGIDTGAFVYGQLTALRLFGTSRAFLAARG